MRDVIKPSRINSAKGDKTMTTRSKAEATAMLEELMLTDALIDLAIPAEDVVKETTTPKDMIPEPVTELQELVFTARMERQTHTVPITKQYIKKETNMPLIANRIANPALMAPVKNTGIFKHLIREAKWVLDPITNKKRKVWEYKGLGDYEDVIAPMPIHSPLKQFVDSGDLRYCRIAQLDQVGKIYKGQKFNAFRTFSTMAAKAGYLCIQPDWKDSELQIFYETPEKLAAFFCISVEKLYKSIGKLHKWLKLIKTPTKMVIDCDTELRVLYIDEPNNEQNRARYDGDIFVNRDLKAFKASGAKIWDGFLDMLQMRSFRDIGILLKGLPIFNEAHFARKAREIATKYGSPKDYDMIINQHSVKFDNIGLEDGKIYTYKADQLFRFVGARFKAGSSTLGAQLVAMNDMKIASGILKEHGLMESAMLIKALAKGMPYAWVHIAHDYNKIDTNKFLELAFCINRPQYGWRMAKMATLHNRNMGFLETEWRKRISSVTVNTESAYAYTDERCDAAIDAWYRETGDFKSFAVVPAGSQLNDKGEIASIKYPLHSSPCIASHTALRTDIFDPNSPLVAGLFGGLGLPTIYQRSVMGLDTDGDKLAKFKTAFSIPVEFDFSIVPPDAPKVEGEPITALHQALEYTHELAAAASADTIAIGTIDLTIRYCFMWSHLNGVEITSGISNAIGSLREGGIKGGVKGDTKGIANASTQLNIPASLEAGTLGADIIAWFGELVGTTPEPLSGFGEINKNNLAELAHFLVVKGAGCPKRGHGDKFLYRMQELVPAYMAHPGDKSNNPWHDALALLSDGIKPEYLASDKNDCKVIQDQYKAVWKYIQTSFGIYGSAGLDYEFELSQCMEFGKWINNFYKRNSTGIQQAFRGHTDRESGDLLVQGDFDADRKARRYIKLLRVIRFLLNGLVPHPADLEQLPSPIIPESVAARGLWFGQKNRQTDAYLKFAHIFIATTEFNMSGTDGNSGGMAWNFPAQVVYDARAMFYDVTPEGKKQERNPFLNLTKDLAQEFDTMWLKRAQDWVTKNPYANEFVYPEADADDYEEDEIVKSVIQADDDYDSID